jgi:nucleoside-diphosphate-sugar epimerase
LQYLVNGGAGFVGSYLIRRLLKEKHNKVIVLDKGISGDILGLLNTTVLQGNVLDGRFLDNVALYKPDVVIHLAAMSVAKECDEDPRFAIYNNIQGLNNALSCARASGSKRFVFISSSFVYGDFKYFPADEAHELQPKGIYAGTKVSGEYLTKTFCKRFGIDWTIIRPSAVYGYGDKNKRVTQVFLENAMKGKPLVVEGANQIIDFTYVEDTVEGIFLASTKEEGKNDTFNITRGEGRTLGELTKVVSDLLPDVEIIESKHDENRPKRGALNISKARSLLGYNPKWSLEDGINQYYHDILDKIPIVK